MTITTSDARTCCASTVFDVVRRGDLAAAWSGFTVTFRWDCVQEALRCRQIDLGLAGMPPMTDDLLRSLHGWCARPEAPVCKVWPGGWAEVMGEAGVQVQSAWLWMLDAQLSEQVEELGPDRCTVLWKSNSLPIEQTMTMTRRDGVWLVDWPHDVPRPPPADWWLTV